MAVDDPLKIPKQADSYPVTTGVALSNFAAKWFTYYSTNESTSAIDTPFTPGAATETLESNYGGTNLDETNYVKSERLGIGACSSCGGTSSAKTYNYFYMKINQGTLDDDNEVKYLIVEDVVDGGGINMYRRVFGLNEVGHELREVLIDNPASSPKYWCRSKVLTATADVATHPNKRHKIIESRPPSAHNVASLSDVRKFLDPYDDGNGGTASWANDTATLRNFSDAAAGPTYVSEYDNYGQLVARKVKRGYNDSSADFLAAYDYGNGTDAPTSSLIASYQYPTKTTAKTSGNKWTFAYVFWDSGKTQVKSVTSTSPSVPTAQNGSGIASSYTKFYDRAGQLRWATSGEGSISYFSYDVTNGKRAYVARDVNPAGLPTSADDARLVAPEDDGDLDNSYDGIPTRDAGLPTALARTTLKEYDELGRRTLVTTASGLTPANVIKHSVVYEELANGSRTIQFRYLGSDGKPRRKTRVTERDELGRVVQSYWVPADYSAIGTAGTPLIPTGFSTEPSQDDYVSWTRYAYDELGRRKYVDRYHDIPASGGTADTDVSTYYYRTTYRYNSRGYREYTIQQVSGAPTPGGNGIEQILRSVFDQLGRVVEIQRGVSLADHNMGADYVTLPTLKTIATATYDNGGVGDGHATKSRTFHTDTIYTDWLPHYTFRGHLRGVERQYYNGSTTADVTPYSVVDLDWMGRVVESAAYTTEPSWATLTGDDGDATYVASNPSGRYNRSVTMYDSIGRVYRTEVYPGQTGSKLQQNNYYDRNGQLVGAGEKYAAQHEIAHDGVGRTYQSRVVTSLVDDSTYGKYDSAGRFRYRAPAPHPLYSSSNASQLSGGDDEVVELTHRVFDADGRVIERHSFEMNDGDSGADLGIDLTADDDYVRRSIYSWYDPDSKLLMTTADYGAGGGSSGPSSWKYNSEPTRQVYGSRPSMSADSVLVFTFAYNSKTGRRESIVGSGPGMNPSPTTVTTKTFYDDLGRTTYVAENYDNFTPATSSTIGDASDKTKDRVTAWQYDGIGNTTKLVTYNGASGNPQETRYYFEDAVNAWLNTHKAYPDSSSTSASGTDLIKQEYNLDGSLKKLTNQRGVIHEYSYNERRQLALDAATTIPSGVDAGIASIKRTYDGLGKPYIIESYASANGTGTFLNRIQYLYEAGQVTYTYQFHDSSGSLYVRRRLDGTTDGDGVFNDGLRTYAMQYPNNATVSYERGHATPQTHSDSLDDRLSRISGIEFDRDGLGTGTASVDEIAYKYNGASRLAETDYLAPDVRKGMYATAGVYDAWDRFGRTLRVQWDKYNSGAGILDKVEYTNDYAGNRLSRNVAASANDVHDYVYQYDALMRLKNAQAGTYNTSTKVIDSRKFEQDWALDALGNWVTFKERDIDTGSTWDVTRVCGYSAANELTAVVSGPLATPQHDAAGNTTSMPKSSSMSNSVTLTYDAWNRLAQVVDPAISTTNPIAKYEYDGLNRRIVKELDANGDGTLNETRHFYYSEEWQVLEERVGANPLTAAVNAQYVWHPEYVDALALRYWDSGGAAGPDSYHYYLQDANYNVTAVVDNAGVVVERYAYSPYGDCAILDGSYSPRSSTAIGSKHLYAGTMLDGETGSQLNRNRVYFSKMGRWANRDPIGYADGFNLYEYVGGMPTIGIDPSGLRPITPQEAIVIVREMDAAAAVGPGRLAQVAKELAAQLGVTVAVIYSVWKNNSKTGSTCASMYPNHDDCTNYSYSGKPQALAAFKSMFGNVQTYSERPATACGAGGGTHWNVKTCGKGGRFAGTIICCVCCEDRPDGNGGVRAFISTGCNINVK